MMKKKSQHFQNKKKTSHTRPYCLVLDRQSDQYPFNGKLTMMLLHYDTLVVVLAVLDAAVVVQESARLP